jgi:hypothetical protein
MKLHVPPVIINRLGPISITPLIGSKELETSTYSQPGDHVLIRSLPLPPSATQLRFSLDRFFRAGELDARELGIIVKSISLLPEV